MNTVDMVSQALVYVLTALVIFFIGFKTYNTECFDALDNILSIGALFVSLITNIYLANKYVRFS
jgi:hypothetical protein